MKLKKKKNINTFHWNVSAKESITCTHEIIQIYGELFMGNVTPYL